MDHSNPSEDGVVRPKSRRARRFAIALAAVAAIAAGSAHAALADGVQLTFSQNPVALGGNETMTATVSSSADEPDGLVTFVSTSGPVVGVLDSNPLGEQTTDSDANTTTATLQTSTLAAGTYTIYAQYSPEAFPQLATIGNLTSATETLVVGTGTSTPAPATTQVLVSAPTTVISTSPVTLTATVSRTSAPAGTPTGTVEFWDMTGSPASELGTAVLTGGVATLVLTAGLAPDTHLIVASYDGDASDLPSGSATISIQSTAPPYTSYQTTSTVTTTPSTIAAGDSVTILATIVQTVTGGAVPPPPGGTVSFSADSSVCGNHQGLGSAVLGTGPPGVSVAANQAAIQLTFPQACDYTITASYSGDFTESYSDAASSGTSSLTVLAPRAATDITYTGATSVEYGHTATLSANVTDQNGNALTGRIVTFALGTQSCSAPVSSTGAASCQLAVTDDVPGGTLTVSVPRDVQTAGGSINLTLTVSQQPTTLSVDYQLGATQTTLTGTLLGDLGPLANQTLSLSLGGETCTATPTSSAGVASCTVATITGQQTAALGGSFAGTSDYQGTTAAGSTVQLVYPTTLVYNGATTAVYNGAATLSATLSDGAGGPSVAGRTLTFTLGSQTCSPQTDGSGNASCTLAHVTQDSGPYTVTVSYAGDGVTLLGSNTSAPFSVTLAPTATVAATPTVGSGTTTLSATLTTSGAPLSGKSLTLTFGGNSCPATTGANGVASCSVTTPSGATATYTATFGGDLDYATSGDTKTVTLLTPATLTYNGVSATDYDDIALLSGTLLGPNKTPLVLQRVTFTMGSQSCVGITDFHGVAFCLLLISQPAGSYPLTVSFAGNSTYASTTATSTFTVTHEETAVTVNAPATALVGSSVTLSGTLLEDGIKPIAGRTLTLKLGTATACTGVTNASGVAMCNVTASGTLGPVTATSSFAGDAYYVASSASTQSLLYALAPGGGSFVIGDRSTTGTVTFWSSQWSRSNSLSNGTAVSSFEGFTKTPATPQCGTNWSTPATTSAPTGTLPTYMAVIVTSSMSKSGSTISGNTTAVVIVKTNSTYGTGTIVATVCGSLGSYSSGNSGNSSSFGAH